MVKVLLAFDRRFWPRPMAQLVCGRGPVTLYWAPSCGIGGPPALTAYATGVRALGLLGNGMAEPGAAVLDHLSRLFPRADPHRSLRDARVVDWAGDPYARGGYTNLPAGTVGARAAPAAADTATVSSPIADTVGAAFRSGLRAAPEASALLRRGRT